MNFCMINDKQTASNSKGTYTSSTIEVENNTGKALENFQNYLFERNIIQEMDHNISSDPNANCDILFFFTRNILFEKSSKTYSYINIYTDNIIYNIYTTYIPPPPIINTLFDVKIH